MTRAQTSGSFLVAVAVFCLAASCGGERRADWASRPGGILVTLKGCPTGSEEAPLDPGQALECSLDIVVRSAASEALMTDFNGFVRVSARPGKVTLGEGQSSSDVRGQDVFVRQGQARGIPLVLQYAFGLTEVWVEDLGYVPPTPGQVPACSDGRDNDGDGRTDYPWDAGCLDKTDDSEEGGTYASGLSQPLWFRNPTLAQVQGRGAPDPSVSPYVGEVVTIDSGFLVVTSIRRDGMTVTDRADPDAFNHIFVYNFNTPPGVRVCDRLASLSGIVGEYYKFTELNFPTWILDPWRPEKGPCPVPEPRLLTSGDLGNNTGMEALESALVRVEDVLVGDHVVNCDLDKDGSVDWRDYDTNACSAECQCSEACDQDVLCTEESQYRAYGQWVVAVGGESGRKLLVVSRDAAPDYDPFAPGHPTRIRSLTGTLRHMSFLKPPWILEPRCPDDIVIAGEPRPIGETCVWPRTGEEEEPN